MTANSTSAAAAKRGAPALVVLGLDDSGKAHASWFNEADTLLAVKAAGMMGMTALNVATDELKDLAAQLPPGRVFASGRAFVPFVKAKLFDQLSRHVAAAVVSPAGDKGSPKIGDAEVSEVAGNSFTKPETPQPVDWSRIGIGHVVLAAEAPDDGWWESVVIKKLSNGIFELRWRDWPELDSFIRRPEHLGLLHPSIVELWATEQSSELSASDNASSGTSGA